MSYEMDQGTKSNPSRWTATLLIVLALAIIGGVASKLIFAKREYVSKEGRFRVSFFAEPHMETLPINDSYFSTNLYLMVEHTATTFHCQVGYMDIPEQSIQDYGVENIYNIVQRYVMLPGSQTTFNTVACDGIQGRELTIDTQTYGIAVCRIFLKGNRVYRCLITNKDKTRMSDPKVKQFLDSFHML